ncbi:MAG: methionine--tRNA ligase [Rhizobiales bacterium]|nr:methionine--tRNA ligase [Hyphomicrobiales bacterium]NRB14931.1 methionine--tRNA ligase [Hyphomicrobiales bacterium]
MSNKTAFYITTSIPYANGVPHIGHAYEMMTTDALARFKALDGFDVLYVTGADEHGQKMLQTAEKAGISVQELAAANSKAFEDLSIALNCSNNDFVRTTEPRHKAVAAEVWRRMVAKGDIYLEKYSGWYSVRDEAYYDEKELTKQENGSFIAPTGTPVEWMEEDSYFFKLSAYEDNLLALYENHPEFVGPDSRRNEVVNFVKGGLRDLSVSRTAFDWGVNVPDVDGHVMYVWVDALTNYLTGAGFLTDDEKFAKYWPCDLHIIGKDILRFHAIYWPAFLMSADIEVPKRVFGHGFINNDGEKMSKSVGNVVDPHQLMQEYGVDQVRYFLMREVPYGRDGSFSHTGLVNRTNADLANDLGNLASRSLSMIAKNCDGKLPAIENLNDADNALIALAENAIEKARKAMQTQQIHLAIAAVWEVVGETNKYFAGQEPWALKKTNPERMGVVLALTAEIIRQVAIMAQPYIPLGAAKFLDMLGVAVDKRDFAHLSKPNWLQKGLEINKPSPIYPRYVSDK